jgi:hypothetical protein
MFNLNARRAKSFRNCLIELRDENLERQSPSRRSTDLAAFFHADDPTSVIAATVAMRRAEVKESPRPTG